MSAAHPVDELFAMSRTFGPAAARLKLRLLTDIAGLKRLSAARLVRVHDTLYFMRAYPDNARVLRAVRSHIAALRTRVEAAAQLGADPHSLINTGLPGTTNSYAYSYAVLQRLVRMYPGNLEFDWDEVNDESELADALSLAVAPAEVRGLEDEYTSTREWLQSCKVDAGQTDLELVLDLFERSPLDPQQQMHVFETCDIPVLYHLREAGSGRCEVSVPTKDVSYQKRTIPREQFPLRPRIVRPLRDARLLPRAQGRRMVDLSLAALCSRNLEIYPLIYANAADVTIVDCGRGIQVLLVGMLPEFRCVPESLFFFLILKNGVPVAYGPASIFLGCCEMGINLFPEFRGGEIRYIYAQFMRSLYHLAHVRYFFLTSYGMGEGNPEALKSGAFWFYRKLGFRATNADVEKLARKEEAVMKRRPGYRSSMATLRELSHTEAHFDLSRGRLTPVEFGRLGQAVSRYIGKEFRGHRVRAQRESAARLAAILGIGDLASWSAGEMRGARELAPILCLIRGLEGWSSPDKRALAGAFRAKGASRELDYVDRLSEVAPLADAIHTIA